METVQHDTPLYRLWHRINTTGTKPTSQEWNEEQLYLSLRGKGMEEALDQLYTTRPAYESFAKWAGPELAPVEAPQQPALTAEDLRYWEDNGYLVVKNAVPEEQCIAARKAIWQYLDADPANPGTWYNNHEGKNGMMLRFFQHPALEANRRSSRIAGAYQQLYGGQDIYLLIDKVSFNPPESNGYKFAGSPLHWDVSLQPPIPYVLQGLLYLDDVSEEDGAFHCVPGFHKTGRDWLESLPPGTDPRQAAIKGLKPVPVCGKAGDLVIWHQALPHCATPNKGAHPRLVQYIAYKPVHQHTANTWI